MNLYVVRTTITKKENRSGKEKNNKKLPDFLITLLLCSTVFLRDVKGHTPISKTEQQVRVECAGGPNKTRSYGRWTANTD